jgi:Uma2 family endonuclease
MATVTTDRIITDYPTSDGKPMAETDWHRVLMIALIQTLDAWFADNPLVYVSGNLLIFYVPGDKRRHVAPDVFVVKGVAKRQRPNYLVWEEGRAPGAVIELTSSSTRKEDVDKKFHLYQDVLKVQEYFLFDPHEDYLRPPLQGYRLQQGRYLPIRPRQGRLPSKVLGLHLERHASDLRLYDPGAVRWLPTPQEKVVQTEARWAQERLAREQAEAEVERLRRDLERLRRRLPRP